MRRSLSIAIALSVLGVAASVAAASPGGGSSGFGGGGGGGGFSGGGGGSGSCGSGCVTISGPWAWVMVGGIFLLFGLIAALVGIAVWRQAKKRRERVARVELAAAEAAQDDAYFEPAELRGAAGALHAELFHAWNDGDRQRLRDRLGPDLMVEWERRLDDFAAKGWRNECAVVGDTKVEYVGLTNRAEESEDRAVVRVSGKMRDVVVDGSGRLMTRNNTNSQDVGFAEYWTLGRERGRWILLSIEQDAEGRHNLDAPIVASPWSDDARLHDQAVTELAVADATPNVAELADLDFDGDARAAALDLSNADGRFAPQVLEAAARRAVAGVGRGGRRRRRRPRGDRDARRRAGAALRRRRQPATRASSCAGPQLRALRITRLDAAHEPPTMTVEADVAGRRYVENRDTAAVVQGSKDRETTFTERWTMALSGPPETPWQMRRGATRQPPRWVGVAPPRGRGAGVTTLLAVPNVSEGRDPGVGRARRGVREAARLLDVHTDADHHRACSRSRASRASSTRRVLSGAREAIAQDRPDGARGRAPARRRARRRADRLPGRGRPRRRVRGGAACSPTSSRTTSASPSTSTASSAGGRTRAELRRGGRGGWPSASPPAS